MRIEDALKLLGFDRLPDEKELKQVYRSLVKRYHPDISGDADTKDLMAQINEAYLVLMHSLTEKKKVKLQETFVISAQTLASLVRQLDEYAVSPAMFKLIYELKGILGTYYKAMQLGKPDMVNAHRSTVKKAYLYLKIFQKVEDAIDVLPPDIKHSFLYRLGEFLAGEYWNNLSKEVNTLLDAYFKAYGLIVNLEGADRASIPSLPSGQKDVKPSPLGVFSAMSIAGKIRSFASRLRLLLEPRVFKMPDELWQEIEDIGHQINDMLSLVYMATDLQKRVMTYSYYGPWMDDVKEYVNQLVAGAMAIGDKEVDIQSLRLIYRSAVAIFDEMDRVRNKARQSASLFFKVKAPYEIQEFAESVVRGEVFSDQSWVDVSIMVKEMDDYFSAILSLKEEIEEASTLLKSIEKKIECLQCPDVLDAYGVLKNRLWERLTFGSSSKLLFLSTLSEMRAIDQFIDMMSLGDCEYVVGVMKGVYSEEILLRKMGKE